MGELRHRSSSRHSRRIPDSVQCGDPGLSRKYFTRKQSIRISTNDLPMEPNHLGFHSPWAFIWYFFFLIAPLAYIYIALMLLRDLCEYFPETIQQPLALYLPSLANVTTMMKSYYGCRIVDIWCMIEAAFFIYSKVKIRYLQSKDPLEACLSAAPMLDSEERRSLWDRIMAVESDPSWLEEWFLDRPSIETISLYDVYDFICWAMFDGRNQEHLTTDELNDLEGFVDDLEYRISLQLYGVSEEEESCDASQISNSHRMYGEMEYASPRAHGGSVTRNRTLSDAATASVADNIDSFNYDLHSIDETKFSSPIKFTMRDSVIEGETPGSSKLGSWSSLPSVPRPRPKQLFQFRRDIEREGPNYFSDLYESYKVTYERYKNMIESADFNPVQDFRNLVAEAAQQAAETAQSAEESALEAAQNMYETIVQPGSQMDKHLSAFGHATSAQLTEAWNSVKGMKERLETANFLSEKRTALMKQVRGNRAMLTRMREMSYAVNSKQMAALMRKITESYEALENIEVAARDGFLSAAGKLTDNSLFTLQEPKRYARYSSDPILGIAAFPLCTTLLLLSATEISVRMLLKRRGFERRSIGPVTYYYHPGNDQVEVDNIEDDGISPLKGSNSTPVVFVHGIGVGLIVYIPLIDALMESGRPLFLPELPYVSALRPWQSSRNVLSPAVVASTMTAMLAYHGFEKGCFIGHSYGTSWLSYVCKYAHSAVAALLFLDPICFCLYHPHLTKSFVYHRPDPGSIAFIARTDMMVNWTIQRAFPWTWIVLFLDQVTVPCTIFLADRDALVPAEKVMSYLKSNGVPLADAAMASREYFEAQGDIKSCVWRDAEHGSFTEDPELVPDIAIACNA
eukprot:CAMPEP_0116129250 /NCGR_PEP_ID=MMETSP0329-20121206/7827_1 /TAXON_ID=697910 /ORGANISM="Pseudo-nitzschia arenysensis, Strain B593" /LENGTH=854 /DNA_ID=CAMNT_0003623511 /DNA_START=204 /DNA_END=2764 /DNA_ORIENTATION=+